MKILLEISVRLLFVTYWVVWLVCEFLFDTPVLTAILLGVVVWVINLAIVQALFIIIHKKWLWQS